MRAIRNGLQGAGIPVENSKGEASAGQEEINVRYAEALDHGRPPRRSSRTAARKSPGAQGKAITFLAKWHYSAAGSSSHIHQSLWSARRQDAAFLRQGRPSYGMSEHDAPLCRRPARPMPARSPISSRPTSIPTSASWPAPSRRPRQSGAKDNRTAGYRLCGEDTKGDPHRVPRRRLRPQPLSRLGGAARRRHRRHREASWSSRRPSSATPMAARSVREIPKTLRDATDAHDQVENAARGLRRRCHRPLRPRWPVGAGRIRPPRDGLGGGARLREGVTAVAYLHSGRIACDADRLQVVRHHLDHMVVAYAGRSKHG